MDYPTSTPYISHSETSRAAADSIEPEAGTLRYAVLAYIRRAGEAGATDEEVQTGVPMRANTQRPRRRELELGGLVRDSGTTRLVRSGRLAVVWVLGDGRTARKPQGESCPACGGTGRRPTGEGAPTGRQGQLTLW
jgi:hypothetical protein